jgi:hypothetical protein
MAHGALSDQPGRIGGEGRMPVAMLVCPSLDPSVALVASRVSRLLVVHCHTSSSSAAAQPLETRD